MSECTNGFLSAFDIEVVKDLTDLHLHSARQVLIPDMYFNCTGNITKWIFSARWEGKFPAFTELQVWRKVNDAESIHVKVGATTLQADQSTNEIYAYSLDPPLAFQEGDILGYFQPYRNISQLDLYLENSNKIFTFRKDIDRHQVLPPSEPFDLKTGAPPGPGPGPGPGPHPPRGNDYPLIGTITGIVLCIGISI